MLTALYLGNFKAFAETQRIPLRPLTLIYGANSAGKSSIIQSLVLARQIIPVSNYTGVGPQVILEHQRLTAAKIGGWGA